MSDENRTVQMHVVEPGKAAPDGDFTFELQARFNSARSVKFALIPSDAELLYKQLGIFLKSQP